MISQVMELSFANPNFAITHLSSKTSSVHQMIATLVTMHCFIKSWCWHSRWHYLWKSLYPAQILTFTFPLQRLLGIHRGGSRACWPAVRTLPAGEWQRLRHHGESQYARLVELASYLFFLSQSGQLKMIETFPVWTFGWQLPHLWDVERFFTKLLFENELWTSSSYLKMDCGISLATFY